MNIKFPASWLREYLKTDLAAKTIANYLTLSGPSVERIEKIGNDFTFDIEVTTNRPDAFSVYGIAREAYAILSSENQKCSLEPPKGFDISLQPDTKNLLPLNVIIKNQSLCPRFTAIIIDNVKIGPSSVQFKKRLEASGIRSLNNIVDISNYIMLELGNPMHTFDYDKIIGSKMTLRAAIQGEKLTTLDGTKRIIPAGSIVIEDEKRLIDLCGIMGGENSQITRRTKRVLFFVQAYDSLTIRKTTQLMAFRTEAASRFEKGIDLESIPQALARAVYLAKKNDGARIASEIIDIYPQKQARKVVCLSLGKLNSYLGIEMTGDNAAKILNKLGFEVKVDGSTLIATAPSYRQAEIGKDVDLIEEICRIYGYHRIPPTLPSGQIPDDDIDILEKVIELKKGLKDLGLTEVISYSIISKKLLSQTGIESSKAVELANPLTEEWQYMRPTHAISHAQIISQNIKIKNNMKIFEIAKIYEKVKGDLPKQDLFLTVTMSNSNFYEIKGIIENVFELIEKDVSFEKGNTNPIFGNNSATIISNNKQLGTFGILKSDIADFFDLNVSPAVCEINLTKVYALPKTAKTYKPIPKYPPVIEDISAIVGESTELDEIIKSVKKISSLVSKIGIIDVYMGKSLPQGKKSVTVRITYQKTSGTPSTEEVSSARKKIYTELLSTFHARIRK